LKGMKIDSKYFSTIIDLTACFCIEKSLNQYRPSMQIYCNDKLAIDLSDYFKRSFPKVNVRYSPERNRIVLRGFKNLIPIIEQTKHNIHYKKDSIDTIIEFIENRTNGDSQKKRYD